MAEDREEVQLIYTKKAKTDTKSRAMDYIDLVTVGTKTSNKGVQIDMRAPNPASWNQELESVIIEMILSVPLESSVNIEALYFDVEALGPFREFKVDNSMGRLQVANVTEALELSTANRRVEIEKIYGTVEVRTKNADIIANDIFSEDKQVRLENEYGDIKMEDIRAQVNVKNSYGRIDIEGFTPCGNANYIRCFQGPVFIRVDSMDSKRLVINNRFEDVDLAIPRDLSTSLSLAVEDEGRIEVSNLAVKPDLVEHNRLNIINGDGDYSIKSAIRGKGNIYVRGFE